MRRRSDGSSTFRRGRKSSDRLSTQRRRQLGTLFDQQTGIEHGASPSVHAQSSVRASAVPVCRGCRCSWESGSFRKIGSTLVPLLWTAFRPLARYKKISASKFLITYLRSRVFRRYYHPRHKTLLTLRKKHIVSLCIPLFTRNSLGKLLIIVPLGKFYISLLEQYTRMVMANTIIV